MAVARVQFGTGSLLFNNGTTTYTTQSVSLPAAATAGNLLVAAWSCDKSSGAFTTPSGWTLLTSKPGASVSFHLVYKIAAGGETSVTGTWATAMSGASAYIGEYSGVDPTTPIGSSSYPAYSDTAVATMSFAPPVATAPGLAIAFIGIDTDTGATTTPAATGYTAVSHISNNATGNGAPLLAVYEHPVVAAGDANSPTFTWTTADQANGAVIELNQPSATNAFSVTPALTGAGSLSTTHTETHPAAPALVGSGALSSTATFTGGTSAYTASPALTGSGALSASGVKGGTAPTPVLNSRVVGIPTTTTGVVSVNTTNASSVRLKVGTDTGLTANVVYGSAVTPNAQGDAILRVTGLTTSTRQFYYRIAMTDSNGVEFLDTATTQGKFRTAPTGPTTFNFNFGSCTDGTDSASMSAMAARNDDLFFHLGDLYYNDGGSTAASGFRTQYQNKFTAANHASLFSTTPSTYTPSDHDGMINNSSAGDSPTSWATWNQVYREKWPTDTSIPATNGVYFTFVWGRIRFIQIDDRSFKTIDSATDNASKTALGTVQKQWLKDTVTAATEQAIIILNSSPWVASSSDGETGWADYLTERNELASFFAASGKKLFILGGDMHALAGATAAASPGGVVALQAAPFNNTASQKGGPWSVGPYPTGSGVVQQYGHVAITDDGVNPVQVNFTGLSSDNTSRVTLNTTLPATQSFTASPALTGSGALSSTATTKIIATASPALAGAGALSAGATLRVSNSAALTGSGTLAATATAVTTALSYSGPANLTGSGSLSALGAYSLTTSGPALTGYAPLDGIGTLGVNFSTAITGSGEPAANPLSTTSTITPDFTGTSLRQITGYTVTEDATPLDIADTSGGVSTISFALPDFDQSILLYNSQIELDDLDNRGTTSGTITDVSIQDGLVSVTADNRLGVLVGNVNAKPRTGTFEAVARYYLGLGGITEGIYFDPRVAGAEVTVQGWVNDAWLMLKQLCTVHRVEISLVSNKIVFRPMRSFITNVRRKTSFTTDIQKAQSAKTVAVNYYNNLWVEGEVIYPRTVDEASAAQIFSVEAGALLEADITLSASVSSVLQPVCVDDVANDYDGTQSVYSVRAIDNSPVSPGDWTALGGKIELTINPDTVSLHIKITGMSDQYRGPYRIAGRMADPKADPTTIIIGPGQSNADTSVTDYGDGAATSSKSTTKTTTVTTTTKYAAAVDDYPWRDSVIDRISPLGYGQRECTDFVMWRMNRDGGSKHAPWRFTWSKVRKTNGDAIGWYHDWGLHGWKRDIKPVPGCIAWFGTSAGSKGHVAYVQAVGPDYVVLEDFNWGRAHGYNKHTMKTKLIDSFLENPGGSTAKTTTTKTSTAPKKPTSVAGYSGVQLTNASEIMRAARDSGFGTSLGHAQDLGVCAAMGESTLRVLDYGDKAGPDSRGLFQQRNSWGPLGDRMNPYKSAILFFNKLKTISGWQSMTATHAIHAVQVNADPEYYTKYYSAAQSVVNAINKSQVSVTSVASQTSTSTKKPVDPMATSAAQIAAQQQEVDYNSLRIVGTGAVFNQQTLTLPTGAVSPTDLGTTATSVYVSTLEDAYNMGVYLGSRYSGETQTISGTLSQITRADDTSGSIIYPTISDFDTEYKGMTIGSFDAQWAGKKISDFNATQKAKIKDTVADQVFGNVAGARFRHGAAYYRIITSTITNNGIDFTATRDTMIGDFNVSLAGKTIADFNSTFSGMSIGQFNRVALLGG